MKARRTAMRRRAREVQVPTMPDPPHMAPESVADIGPILDEELARLPAWYRDAIVLCDLRGLSREEAAKLLGIPEGTLSSRLANGRKTLATRLTKRGVTLSVAAMPGVLGGMAQANVPPELMAMANHMAAGKAIPTTVSRLASGEFTMTTKLVMTVMGAAAIAVGAVFATQAADPPKPTQPPKPPTVAKGDPAPEQKPDPAAKEGEKVEFTTSPRRSFIQDAHISNVNQIAWSPDGSLLAYQGTAQPLGKGDNTQVSLNAIFMIRINATESSGFGGLTFGKSEKLVGFSNDGKSLIAEVREYNLVSGFHRLTYRSWKDNQPRKEKDAPVFGFVGEPGTGTWKVQKIVELDSAETHGYAFSADGKTFRTVAFNRTPMGIKFIVQEVDAATGKTLKSLLTVDGGMQTPYALSSDGKRLALLWGADVKSQVLQIYDVDGGDKTVYVFPEEKPDAAPYRGIGDTSIVFSQDGKRLVLTRGIGRVTVHNCATGKLLPVLEGADVLLSYPAPHAFSADSRLIAMTGRTYAKKTTKSGFGGEQTSWSSLGQFLAVWEIETGKLLKMWDAQVKVVGFHPSKPILAILEPNGESATRIGLWDFAAATDKK
jgi:predicted DNA-binding protein (UPF0251 family)/WD40 repeat protein